MLERLHEHIVNELGQSSRTDTIFIVVAVVFNLIALGINAGSAASARASGSYGTYSLAADIILTVFILMTLFVNAIALSGLLVGRQVRGKLIGGLVAMYSDNQVDKYYDRSLVSNYGMRYVLFASVIAILAATAILVPLIVRIV